MENNFYAAIKTICKILATMWMLFSTNKFDILTKTETALFVLTLLSHNRRKQS
jgi:hypothetical protein